MAAWLNCALLLQRNSGAIGGMIARNDVNAEALTRATRAGRTARKLFRGTSVSKRGNKNYFKGRGAPKYGTIDSRGRFHLDKSSIPVYELPDSLPEAEKRVDEYSIGRTDILLPYVWRAPAEK